MIIVLIFFFCSRVVVSAGVFRIFGAEVAELPLVATITDCQGQVFYFTYSNEYNILFYVVLSLRNSTSKINFLWMMTHNSNKGIILLFSRVTSKLCSLASKGFLDL